MRSWVRVPMPQFFCLNLPHLRKKISCSKYGAVFSQKSSAFLFEKSLHKLQIRQTLCREFASSAFLANELELRFLGYVMIIIMLSLFRQPKTYCYSHTWTIGHVSPKRPINRGNFQLSQLTPPPPYSRKFSFFHFFV